MRTLLSKFRFTSGADLTASIYIKIVSDWGRLLKKLSPIAGPLFILLNLGSLIRNKKALVTLAILLPLLVIHPREEILRIMFSIAVFWIFLEKFTTGFGKFNPYLAIVPAIYGFIIFGCILRPDFYVHMDDGSLRYKFILETHNALSILVFIIFIYLCETFFDIYSRSEFNWLKPLIFASICALAITFLFIKSRIYIGMSLGYLIIVTLKLYKRIRFLPVIPVLYIVAFAGLTEFAKVKGVELAKADSIATATTSASATATAKSGNMPNPDSGKSDKKSDKSNSSPAATKLTEKKLVTIVEDGRLLKSNATGRGKLTKAVLDTYDSVGWKRMIYGYNLEKYLEIKARIPFINVNASSLTENSYFTTVLVSGLVGLVLLLYLLGLYIAYFVKRKQLFSLAFLCLLLGVWYFEETVMFTFSLIGHLLALASINNLEKKTHESSSSR